MLGFFIARSGTARKCEPQCPVFPLRKQTRSLAAVAAKGYEILQARTLAALRGKTKPADALKAMVIAYLRFGTGNPAHYRLMFGPTLQGQDGGLPSEVIRAFGSAETVCREVLKRGSEDGTFKIPENDPAALEIAVVAVWSLEHGLTMRYIDGLATLETAQTIDGWAEKVVTMFMYGLVEARKTGLGSLLEPNAVPGLA